MHIPIHLPNKLRFLLAFCFVMILFFIILIKKETKQKDDYDHITGQITLIDSRLGEMPNRDFGKYRYLKLANYDYPFEIYTDEQGIRVDSLHKGDQVTAYFYESDDLQEEGINRTLQYLQKGNKLYFSRTDFKKNMGYYMILFLLGGAYFFYYLYKKGKIEY